VISGYVDEKRINKQQLSQNSVPLFEACRRFLATQTANLYCPGHKGGRTLPDDFKALIAELDLNNLAELDTLHCPSGPIAKAEELLADAYSVEKSFILVGGSSTGNIASVLSVCQPGDEILVQRNMHKSTMAGIVLAGAKPLWLVPEQDESFGIYHGVHRGDLDTAFRTHPRAVAAVVLNPTYYGTVADIRALREVCDRHGKLLLVDEAHGPHFHFHRELPLAAEDAGADLVVQSTHKILSGLSQAAVLHSASGEIPVARIRKTLQLIQTTSPSFPVMISIDLARWQMVHQGQRIWTEVLAMARWAREELQRIPGVRIPGRELLRGAGSGLFDLDETKIMVDAKELGVSGRALLNALNERGVKLELSGPTHVLAILTVGSRWEDVRQLVAAVREIARGGVPVSRLQEPGLAWFPLPEQAMQPRECFLGAQESVALDDAAGRICAETVTPYPPGIPVLMPGEKIDLRTLQNLMALRQSGCSISASTPALTHILVSNVS
jgi:arginine/lysine/ornithine decarboxylase